MGALALQQRADQIIPMETSRVFRWTLWSTGLLVVFLVAVAPLEAAKPKAKPKPMEVAQTAPVWVATLEIPAGRRFCIKEDNGQLRWVETGDLARGFRVGAHDPARETLTVVRAGTEKVELKTVVSALSTEELRAVESFVIRSKLRQGFLVARRWLETEKQQEVLLGAVPGALAEHDRTGSLAKVPVRAGARELSVTVDGRTHTIRCVQVKVQRGDSATRLAGRYEMLRGDLLLLNPDVAWEKLKERTLVWVLAPPKMGGD